MAFGITIERKGAIYCGYVELGTLRKEKYPYETYRSKTVIGVDSGHEWNFGMTDEEQKKDIVRQLDAVIEEHVKEQERVQSEK